MGMSKQSMAWDVSGFGAAVPSRGGGVGRLRGAMALDANTSMMAQPGTPARGGGPRTNLNQSNYVYGGSYDDINLRGDRIGEVQPQMQPQKPPTMHTQIQNESLIA